MRPGTPAPTTRPTAVQGTALGFARGLAAAALLASAACPALAQQQLARPPDTGAPKGGFVEPDKPSPAPLSAEALDTLRRINAYRAAGAQCGQQRFEPAPPLAWSAQLEQAAVAHARDMAARRSMSHTGGDGSSMSDRVARVGYHWGALGENVSAGYRTVPEGLDGWMKSPGHCGNIMGAQFREVGVGAANAPGGGYGWFRAMVLSTPR
jgi:uncharacterized protein YkwD